MSQPPLPSLCSPRLFLAISKEGTQTLNSGNFPVLSHHTTPPTPPLSTDDDQSTRSLLSFREQTGRKKKKKRAAIEKTWEWPEGIWIRDKDGLIDEVRDGMLSP